MEKEEGASAAQEVPAGVPKKSGAKVLTIVGAVVIAGASAAAGAIFAPSLKKQPPAPAHEKASKAAAAEEDEEDEEEAPAKEGAKGGHMAALEALVVDVRDEAGESHHIKVALALELSEAVKEEEWKAEVVPRARDATIAYLRSLKYEDAASSTKFETMRTDLAKRIAKAVKKPRVKKVFFVDYVVQ